MKKTRCREEVAAGSIYG